MRRAWTLLSAAGLATALTATVATTQDLEPRAYSASPAAPDLAAACQRHVSHGLWLAVDGTWYGGGETFVDDGTGKGRLDNTRIGATLSIPLRGRRSSSPTSAAPPSVSARTSRLRARPGSCCVLDGDDPLAVS